MAKTNVSPLGYPHYGAGHVEVLVKEKDGSDYSVLFAPDPNNNELREAGLPMQFYYYPKVPRLAKHPDGRFKFSMQVFKGAADETTVLGAEGLEEEAGAFASMTSTIDLPEEQLKIAIDHFQQDLIKKYSMYASGINGLYNIGKEKLSIANIRPIQLTENKISMHVIGEAGDNPFGGSNPWTHNIQGAGAGQTFGLGENAFSMLMGRNSALLLKDSLEKGGNNLVVENAIKYKAYMPSMIIKTTVHGQKTHNYFSGKLNASAGILNLKWEEEYEKLKTEGHIETEIFCDDSLTTEEMNKIKESLVTQQRENAFKALQKCIFEPEDKKFEAAKDPEKNKQGILSRILWGDLSIGVSLKHGYQERDLDYTDEVKYSGVYSLSSKISGNMDPLIKPGEKNPQEVLSQYIQEVRLDEDFSKVHIVAELAGELSEKDSDGNIMYSPVKKVTIEVGYPDSKGRMVWKSSGRKIPADGSGTPYVTKDSRDGKKTIDAIYPAIWASNDAVDDLFVFDFVANDKPTPAKLRRTIVYAKHKNVCVKDNKEEVDIQGSKCIVEFPEIRMFDYKITPETMFSCDTMEVTIKADQVGAKKIVFTEDNCDDIVPFQVWYDKTMKVKPAQYKLKYTCKGKVGKTLKKETITTDWIDLDFESGDLILQIPEGTEKQNKTVESIRKTFMEDEE